MTATHEEPSEREANAWVRALLGFGVVVAVTVCAAVGVGAGLMVALLVEIVRNPCGGVL